MRNKIIRIRSAVWLSAAALLLGGCVKRDLEVRPTPPPAPKNGCAEIALDWGDAAVHPQSACYLFYDEEGTLVKTVTGLSDGFRDSLPAGRYRLVVHNEDARQVDYRGMESYATAEVFAQETQYTYGLRSICSGSAADTYTTPQDTDAHRASDAGAQASSARTRHDPGIPCIMEPLQVFGTGACSEFDLLEITAGETTRATVAPAELTKQMKMLFVVKNIDEVQSLRGVLAGIVPGVFIATGAFNTTTSCALEFEATPFKAPDTEFTAVINVFNLLTTDTSPTQTNTVYVSLTDGNGTVHEVYVDLTATLKEIIAENGGVIPVEVPVEVELEMKAVEGLTATVKLWDESGTGGGDFD